MKKSFYLLFSSVFLFAGCTQNPSLKKISKTNQVSLQNTCVLSNIPESKNNKNSCIEVINATGIGVTPTAGVYSQPQALAMARRAAILDAYKSLAEKLYGIKINGKDTIRNMVLQNSDLKSYVNGLIRGANIEEESYKNGMYKVTMSIKINVKEWNKYLQNMSAY